MYDIKNLAKKQPVAIAGTLRAVLHTLVLLGVVAFSADQLAGLSLAAELILGLFAWNAVTPVENMERHPDGDPQ